MSAVYVIDSAAVGLNGGTVFLEAGAEHDSDSAVVVAHPHLFTVQAPETAEAEAAARLRPNAGLSPAQRAKRGRS